MPRFGAWVHVQLVEPVRIIGCPILSILARR